MMLVIVNAGIWSGIIRLEIVKYPAGYVFLGIVFPLYVR